MIEHKSISLADQVFERLETDILSGKYQPGDVLTELKLVADLGVSRTPIREALRRLEQEHLIEISQKGILVIGVTKKDLADIMEIRMRVEGLAAYECAKNITDEQLEELRETLELQEFYVPKQDANRINTMDSKFHELIYRFSNSIALYDTLIPLHKKVLKYRRTSVENAKRSGSSSTEHRAIFEAIAAHNAELAEKCMKEHIANANAFIQEKENR
ncbi:MAG: GntR family transcriptional regulator [Clostridia bacterium]|nr:GntR family transcriptional regulator [Clostridia bacterium]